MTVAASEEADERAGPGSWPLIVRWPDDRGALPELVLRRVPVLLLLDGDSAPPPGDDPLIDWLRLPVDARDLDARLERLRELASRWSPAPSEPMLDGAGRLYRQARWVPVTPTEEILLSALLDGMDKIVLRRDLLARGWPDGGASDASLRLHMMRLRQRIRPLGLEIRTIRGKGYALAVVAEA